MAIYNTDFNTEYKADNSPLTAADTKSNEIIIKGLKEIATYPILTEETENANYEVRKNWSFFWLVDPLDGTKEFVNRNGEFTVNIALIKECISVLGLIYLPVQKLLYFAGKEMGAYKLGIDESINSPASFSALLNKAERLPIAKKEKAHYTIAVSRSHLSPKTEDFIKNQKELHGDIQIISAGSSYKFCLVAEGKADVYPRLGPTMEWDTAAGHIIANEAGKRVLALDTGDELSYNKPSLLNPDFLVG